MQKELLDATKRYEKIILEEAQKRFDEDNKIPNELFSGIIITEELTVKNISNSKLIIWKEISFSKEITDKYKIYHEETSDFVIEYDYTFIIMYVLEDKTTGKLYNLFFIPELVNIENECITKFSIYKLNKLKANFSKHHYDRQQNVYHQLTGSTHYYEFKQIQYEGLDEFLDNLYKNTHVTVSTFNKSPYIEKGESFEGIHSYLRHILIHNAYVALSSSNEDAYTYNNEIEELKISVNAKKIERETRFIITIIDDTKEFDIGCIDLIKSVINVNLDITVPTSKVAIKENVFIEPTISFDTTLYDLINNKN